MSTPAAGQQWVAEVSAGRRTQEPVAAALGTTGASLSIRHEGSRWIYLSGGFPFDGSGLPWGALGAGTRLSMRREIAAPGLDLSGHAYGYRDRAAESTGGGIMAEAMPLVSVGSQRTRLDLRSGILYHSSAYSGQTTSRHIHASDARLVFGPVNAQLTAEGRYWRAEEGNYPYAGASLWYDAGVLDAWVYAGKWFSDSIEQPAWGLGISAGVVDGIRVHAAFQRDTNDPLYGTPPRTSWTVGLSRRLGGALPVAPLPVTPDLSSGEVVFRLPLSSSAGPPAVAGDFNTWNPILMSRRGEFWVTSLPIGPGVYHYAYRRSDGEWFVPEGAPGRTDDGFGGESATLVVP